MRWIVVLAFLLVSCTEPAPAPAPVKDVASVDSRLVPNLRHPGPRIYSSGMPEGDEAFREIAALGIKTVISVDGEQPDVEAAHRAGLRYVHLPVPYSGISAERELEITEAVRLLPGPVLVHCHHGKHRGPAAAAIARLALGDCTNDGAVAEMKAAGTDPHFEGLYASVASFHAVDPGADRHAVNFFPERAPPEPLVVSMVDMDHRLDRLKAGKPEEGSFAHEALLLREALQEVGRRKHGSDKPFFIQWGEAMDAAKALEREAGQGNPSREALQVMERACNACHVVCRDR